jgi:hypothetical protein
VTSVNGAGSFAQPPDVNIDGSFRPVAIAPDVAEQEITREHAATMFEEALQQQEFLRRASRRALVRD